MKTSQDYEDKSLQLEVAGFGRYIDRCVDAENVLPLKEGDENYWRDMCCCLVDSVRMRAEQDGINTSDYDF